MRGARLARQELAHRKGRAGAWVGRELARGADAGRRYARGQLSRKLQGLRGAGLGREALHDPAAAVGQRHRDRLVLEAPAAALGRHHRRAGQPAQLEQICFAIHWLTNRECVARRDKPLRTTHKRHQSMNIIAVVRSA